MYKLVQISNWEQTVQFITKCHESWITAVYEERIMQSVTKTC